MTFGICEPDGYLPRVADMRLDDALRSSGAVYIKGPKWCGKTETGIHHTRSQVYLQDPDKSPALLAMADSKPSELLIGDKPRLIDEWQMAPQLWDAVRFAVDREKMKGVHALIEATIEVGDVVKHTEDKGETAVVVVAHIVFFV